MLIDRTHRRWLLVSTVVLAASATSYAVYVRLSPGGPSGGSFLGLMYGIAGSAMMLFAGLLAARKCVPTWRLGSAQFWMRGHIWLGTLSLPLILFHSGFAWGGMLENVLWVTLGVVFLTGVYGLAVQHVLPRLMTLHVPLETFAAQIPFLIRAMQFEADKRVAETCGPLDVPYADLCDVAREVARQRKWLKREGDFEKLLAGIYAGASAPAGAKERADSKSSGPSKPLAHPAGQSRSAAAKRGAAGAPAATDSAGESASSNGAAAVRVGAGVQNKAETPAQQGGHSDDANGRNGASPPPSPGVEAGDVPSAVEVLQAVGAVAASPAAQVRSVRSEAIENGTPPQPNRQMKAVPPTRAVKPSAKPRPALPSVPRSQPKSAAPTLRRGVLKEFYLHEVRPYLNATDRLAARSSRQFSLSHAFAHMRSELPVELHDLLEQLQRSCEQRRQFAVQRRIHRWMHGWLIVHVPFSIALAVLFVAHVVMALRVVPFSF